MRISVVIPTFRRRELLERCLVAVLKQSLPPEEFEVIAADNAGEFAILQLVREMATGSDVAIRYLRASLTPGPAHARNRGWRAATGDIIAFTDDDTIPDENWLVESLKVFDSDANLAAAAGKIVVPLSENPTDYEANEAGLASADFVTANCFCRREVLEFLGGFDERFTLAWREDSDLYFRLLENGFRVGRVDGAVVVHPIRTTGFGISVLQQRKIMLDALLFKKHPSAFRRAIGFFAGRYYLMITAFLTSIAAFAMGHLFFSAACFTIWIGSTASFCFQRLKRTKHAPMHVLEMIVTSVLIPPTAVFWRLYGAAKFRVLFY
jgi:GT2 family glycosyltransferase